ncbi:MAG: hypothetical protein M1118_05495, partial [Chloroflexi bacterium]|nr:hypothetical protein [Chloroflexota bacterium]
SYTTSATTSANNGWQFDAVFTNSAGTATSNAATLTVNVPPVITTQPTSLRVEVGSAISFTAAASGQPAPAVQWQVSTDNGTTWNNVAGATSTSYSLIANGSYNGYQYRAVFTNVAGSAATNGATLTTYVNDVPRGWIFGHITLAGSGTPVPGATVALANTPVQQGPLSGGDYQFPAISTVNGLNQTGAYTVVITPPAGYTAVSAATVQVTVTAGQGAEADFTLQPASSTPTSNSTNCTFVLGFKTLQGLIPNIVGNCLTDEQHNPVNGDGLQPTANGLLVWRKADNFTAFTDGYHTWVNGPYGVQERLNTQRFPWEANPDHLPVVGG